MLRLKQAGGPMPAAIAPGTPWADLTGAGDSVQANEFVDNVLVSNTGWVGAAGPLYAGGRSLDDPLVSPLFGARRDRGTAHGSSPRTPASAPSPPPAARSRAQTRTASLSSRSRVPDVTIAGGSPVKSPETAEAFGEIADFFDAHLAG